jgi:uncharacterized protein YkwD
MRRSLILVLPFCLGAAQTQTLVLRNPTKTESHVVVEELSRARTNPKEYAQHLKALRSSFEGTLWKLPNHIPIRTEEGLAALDEAIAFLEKAKAIGPLRWNDGLAKAAQDHVLSQGPTGQTGHTGPDGSTLHKRLLRHGTYISTFGEVLNYGEESARMHVIQLLVDDGVPSRGHRKNVFNPEFHAAGAAMGPHQEFGAMCVVDFADAFTEN